MAWTAQHNHNRFIIVCAVFHGFQLATFLERDFMHRGQSSFVGVANVIPHYRLSPHSIASEISVGGVRQLLVDCFSADISGLEAHSAGSSKGNKHDKNYAI